MRTTFVNTLTELAKKDSSVMLLTGDLGFTVLEKFRDELPNQYLNAGVAEQNMIGVAAGLAMSGKRVFVYSIIPFVTFRCFEQIRNDVCYHDLPVTIVGVGAGYSYAHMGSTHHAMEDVSVMRSLANMTVIAPGDPIETELTVRALIRHDGPAYLRLGKAGEPKLYEQMPVFSIGKAIIMREGTDVTLISNSVLLKTALDVADLLSKVGTSVRLLSMPTVKPIDRDAITQAAAETKLIVTIDEHSSIGGLGSAVAEVISTLKNPARHMSISAPDSFAATVGSQAYLREQAGLTPQQISDRILQEMK